MAGEWFVIRHCQLFTLPMRCSASFMFAINNVKSCNCLIRRALFSIRTRTYASVNNIIQCIVQSDNIIYFTSALRRQWNIMLCNLFQFSHLALYSCLALLLCCSLWAILLSEIKLYYYCVRRWTRRTSRRWTSSGGAVSWRRSKWRRVCEERRNDTGASRGRASTSSWCRAESGRTRSTTSTTAVKVCAARPPARSAACPPGRLPARPSACSSVWSSGRPSVCSSVCLVWSWETSYIYANRP